MFFTKIDSRILLLIYFALIFTATTLSNFFLIISPGNLILSLGMLTFPVLFIFLSFE